MVSYLPIFHFSSTCSCLPVVWSDVRCCVQRHHLPHHHLRPHGNESRPRGQVQCPSDRHSHRRHHQPSGHPHSRRDLRHGGCLAHRTGWDFTTAIHITVTFGQHISFLDVLLPFFAYPQGMNLWFELLQEGCRKLCLSVSHHRDFLKRRFNKWESLGICREGRKRRKHVLSPRE